ncbi:MAG: hypothetical protein HYX47_13240 [Burkholderiales bacterium]|nr:hypothetical protein [Burkholderiales bacterium]
MQLHRPLRASNVSLIEELVSWRCKIRDIKEVVEEPERDVECYSRALYARLPNEADRRPPNGPTGSATSMRLRFTDLQQYIVLASDYLNMVSRGVERGHAMLASFRHHFRSTRRASSDEQRVNPSVWFGLSRNLDRGEASLIRCGSCTGLHLVERASERKNTNCIWCEAELDDMVCGLHMHHPLPAAQIALIEELVSWRCKIKDIEWILRANGKDVAACARAIYAALPAKGDRRPPNGSTGSATSMQLRISDFQQYVSIATDYQNLLSRGVPRDDAMLAAFRFYYLEMRTSEGDDDGRVNASAWFLLSRHLDVGNAALIRCISCSGLHLVERISDRTKGKCSWCSGKLGFHNFARRPTYSAAVAKMA